MQILLLDQKSMKHSVNKPEMFMYGDLATNKNSSFSNSRKNCVAIALMFHLIHQNLIASIFSMIQNNF